MGRRFQAQFAFLIRRFEQLRALDLGPRSQKMTVTDFILEKDKIFACLNLADEELETYNRYYNYFRDQLPTPDLVIYLQATPEVLKKRLKKKNAPGEKAINEEYLEEVVKAYEHFFFHYTSSDLLIVNTSEIDFVERNEDLQELLRKVSAPIKGTQYFLPLGSQEAASALGWSCRSGQDPQYRFSAKFTPSSSSRFAVVSSQFRTHRQELSAVSS